MSLRLHWPRATIRNTSSYWISPTSASHLLFSLTMASSLSAPSNNSTYGLPSNGNPQTVSVDPRMTIHNTSGPGSAYYVRSSSINRSEESTCAPTARYVDVGTPNYAPAPNHQSVAFCLRSDADSASPSRGISIPSFFEDNFDDLMEAPHDTPLASTPAGEGNTILLEFHWPCYMRYSVDITIACRRTRNGRFVRQHIARCYLGRAIAEHAIRFVRMAQLETANPPIPLGTRSAQGVTTEDLLLRSLDPLISPEGHVVWVPHFTARYPLGKGHLRPYCQRTRW
ncbi:hypothetical protein EDB92DRAFT_1858602 [Lactarius akahatsu]|uniref:Uncharacterized protein n=1 Tax=Lactarius akahatsu TaxID=416441 RepID=A0AAD4LKV8_9AGAM|nr:hypothetical protein EDB92DRAFT_1858602 [Lactarius akahatsu]